MKYADVLAEAQNGMKNLGIKSLDKMDPKRKKALVKALRSGEYKQGQGALCQGDKWRHQGDRFCCLGVLTDQYIKAAKGLTAGWQTDEMAPVDPDYNSWTPKEVPMYKFDDDSLMPTARVRDWAGLSRDAAGVLANLNDCGASFKQIARYIEENL